MRQPVKCYLVRVTNGDLQGRVGVLVELREEHTEESVTRSCLIKIGQSRYWIAPSFLEAVE